MKHVLTRTLTAAVLAGALVGLGAPAHAQSGAKALFYSPSGATVEPSAAGPGQLPGQAAPPGSTLATGMPTTPGVGGMASTRGTQEYMGVTYWVELIEANGQRRRVTTDHVFRNGDRIKLHVMSNRDGYLSLINIGSTGRSHMLFPNPAQGGGSNNFVKAFSDYEAPTGYLRFDNNPGEEILMLVLSSKPTGAVAGNVHRPGGAGAVVAPPAASVPLPTPSAMPGMPSSPPSLPSPPQSALASLPAALPPVASAQASQASADADRAAREFTAAAQQLGLKGAKDLVVETDTASEKPASYVVAPASAIAETGVISFKIRLGHR